MKKLQICGDWTTCNWTTIESMKKIKGEIKNYSKTNENATQDLWDARKTVLREKLIEQAYLNKQEKSQINSLTL